VHCPWEAEAGYHYYVQVEGRDNKGNRVTRQEQRTRWEPASGVVDHVFDDEPVPGTQGLPLALLRQVEPFPTQNVLPYNTAFLSGHVVEHYKVVLLDAAKQSQEQMHAALEALCGQQVPGDTYRNLRIFPEYSGQTFKHVLVPVWLLTYNYGAKAFQVIVNGYTGRIAGKYPFSVWKIVLLVALALIALGVFLVLQESGAAGQVSRTIHHHEEARSRSGVVLRLVHDARNGHVGSKSKQRTRSVGTAGADDHDCPRRLGYPSRLRQDRCRRRVRGDVRPGRRRLQPCRDELPQFDGTPRGG
jgi:hypothetical protein